MLGCSASLEIIASRSSLPATVEKLGLVILDAEADSSWETLTSTARFPAAGGNTTFTVSVAETVVTYVAEIVTGVESSTEFVVIVKVAVVLPEGTVTDCGIVAAPVLLLERVTVVPPAGAGALKVTVACEDAPDVTEPGLSVREETPTTPIDMPAEGVSTLPLSSTARLMTENVPALFAV